MEEKFKKLVGFVGKTFKSDSGEIAPLQHLMEEEFDLTEVCRRKLSTKNGQLLFSRIYSYLYFADSWTNRKGSPKTRYLRDLMLRVSGTHTETHVTKEMRKSTVWFSFFSKSLKFFSNEPNSRSSKLWLKTWIPMAKRKNRMQPQS